MATPLPLVVTVALPVKVPLGPETGAVKVTDQPGRGLVWSSVMVATSGDVKAVLTLADWPLPVVAVIVFGCGS